MHRFERWREALHDAPSEKTIAQLIQDYVSFIPAADRDGLPPKCQQVLAQPTADIRQSAVALLECELAYRDENAQTGVLLHEIAHTFAAAAVRLAQLSARSDFIDR